MTATIASRAGSGLHHQRPTPLPASRNPAQGGRLFCQGDGSMTLRYRFIDSRPISHVTATVAGMPPSGRPNRRSRSTGRWSSTSGDFTVQPRWANDHQRPGRLVTGHNEAVRTVPRHEHKAARGGDPPVVVAEPLQLAIKQVEHLVFTGMEMCRHGQPRRVGALHNGELAERIRTRGLDDNASAAPVVGVAFIRRTDIPAHRAPPPIARPPVCAGPKAAAATTHLDKAGLRAGKATKSSSALSATVHRWIGPRESQCPLRRHAPLRSVPPRRSGSGRPQCG